MKKIIAILTVALLALSLFAGCGSEADDSSSHASDNTPAPADTPAPAGNDDSDASVSSESDDEAVAEPVREAPEKTDFVLGHLNSTAHLLAFVAADAGFFEEEGLSVEVTLFASAGEMAAGLVAGQLDAAFIGSVPTITTQASGLDLTIFGGAMSNGHGYVIKSDLVPEDFVEGDITVLTGRNVASVRNSVQDYELLYLLRKFNLEIGEGDDQVNVVYFESQRDAYNALASNEIDAVSVYSPYASVAQGEGHTVVYYCNEVEDFRDQPCCRQVALTEALGLYPNTYIAFERALIKAYKFSQENREETIDIVGRYITIERDQIEYEVYGGHAKSVPDPDRLGTSVLKEGVVEFGYTDGVDYDIDSLYNIEIYRTALEQLLEENPDDSIYQELKEHFESAN